MHGRTVLLGNISSSQLEKARTSKYCWLENLYRSFSWLGENKSYSFEHVDYRGLSAIYFTASLEIQLLIFPDAFELDMIDNFAVY